MSLTPSKSITSLRYFAQYLLSSMEELTVSSADCPHFRAQASCDDPVKSSQGSPPPSWFTAGEPGNLHQQGNKDEEQKRRGRFCPLVKTVWTLWKYWFCKSKVAKHQQSLQKERYSLPKLQMPLCTIMKVKGVLKDKLTANCVVNTWIETLLKGVYTTRLTLLMDSILKYWARGIEPLLLVWGNESTTPRQARLMGKHVNEGCFSYLGPQARGLIQETASLRSAIHPSTNLREGTTLPRAWDEVLAQRGMTNARSSQGLQAEQEANLNSTNFWP